MIQESIRDGVVVLQVSGPSIGGPDVKVLHRRILALATRGVTRVVVDFSKTRWFGAAMLGVLIDGLKLLRSVGGDLRLAGVSQKMERVLKTTRLADFFRVLETADRAVVSFERKTLEHVAYVSELSESGALESGEA